ncbi:hypothetical protein PPGU19_068780 (plasmid) [Paraburkholderia sp. PGU19]|uniref:hypothetical protein n=1 Tax=Paraburkholderia sp. PGU19 TaxID=2735434 RepID=UPI0015DA3061|nr:hypothetical protein [Paraburkholderia sp. PGU19]BCG02310.1 hypothetical protein PPGU19_068780 [Paraburkholderia sp. PGU19]
MSLTSNQQDSFGSALHMLVSQQRDTLRTILALSDTTRHHDAASARAALAEIFRAAGQCHSTYRAMLVEIIATQQEGYVSRQN